LAAAFFAGAAFLAAGFLAAAAFFAGAAFFAAGFFAAGFLAAAAFLAGAAFFAAGFLAAAAFLAGAAFFAAGFFAAGFLAAAFFASAIFISFQILRIKTNINNKHYTSSTPPCGMTKFFAGAPAPPPAGAAEIYKAAPGAITNHPSPEFFAPLPPCAKPRASGRIWQAALLRIFFGLKKLNSDSPCVDFISTRKIAKKKMIARREIPSWPTIRFEWGTRSPEKKSRYFFAPRAQRETLNYQPPDSFVRASENPFICSFLLATTVSSGKSFFH
jgi:hypothetical protein